MIEVLGRVDDDAEAALFAAARRIGLPGDPDELFAALVELNDETWDELAAQWREQWSEIGGYLEYPDVWVVDQLGEWAWSGQRKILRSVFRHRKTAVVSSYGIGKDWTAARVIACFLDQHPPGEAFVVSTAPTFAQVRAILWREVQVAFNKANALAVKQKRPSLAERGHRLNLTEWWVGKEMVGFGRKPSGSTTAAFQGIHAKRVLVVLDEAGGVPEDLFEDAEKLVTTEHSHILAIGNPTHEGTYWHKVCSDPDWNVLHFSAFDTPNFTGEPIPAGLGDMLTSKLWVEERRRKYGESSPRWQQQVLGRFSKDRMMTAIPLDWARASIRPDRYGPNATAAVERSMVEMGGIRVLGVDVAAGGSDWTVIRERVGDRTGRMWRTQSGEPREQVELIAAAAYETQASRVVIDSIGIGYGIVELVKQALPHVSVLAADASEASEVVRLPDGRTVMLNDAPPETETLPVFLNKRAEWWWAARERSMLASDPSYRPIVPYVRAWDLTSLEYDLISGLPLDEADETLDELTTPGYEHVTRGKTTVIKVESKDELRKASRLGRSTDHADPVLLAFFQPPTSPPPAVEFGGRESLAGATGRRTSLVDSGRRGQSLVRR